MRRILAIVAVALVLVVITVAGVIVTRRDDGPVYSVAQVQAGLQQHPRQWFGKTIRVHGWLGGYLLRGGEPFEYRLQQDRFDIGSGITDPESVAGPFAFVLGSAQPSPLLTWLRRAPFLDRVIPDHGADGTQDATYRVRIVDASADPGCPLRPCYRAILLDPPPLPPHAPLVPRGHRHRPAVR